MTTQLSEDISNIVQAWTYELPIGMVKGLNPDGSIIVDGSEALEEMLNQQQELTIQHEEALDDSKTKISSLEWQLSLNKNSSTELKELKVANDALTQENLALALAKPKEVKVMVTEGYISLDEHHAIRQPIANELHDHKHLNKKLTGELKLLSVDLGSIKPALEQAHEANKQLVIKFNKSKEKIQSAVERELASAKTFNEGVKAFEDEIRMLRTERTVQHNEMRKLRVKLSDQDVELKDARELVAISGRQVLWENPRRGTWLTYMGLMDNGSDRPKVVDGTELDMNKPIFSFHHPSGVSRMVLCGKDDENSVIFCANTVASKPTASERESISELVKTIDFDQVQQYFDEQKAKKASRTKFVSEKAIAIHKDNT